jgi:hypothetical protein
MMSDLQNGSGKGAAFHRNDHVNDDAAMKRIYRLDLIKSLDR